MWEQNANSDRTAIDDGAEWLFEAHHGGVSD
jgi:hypothetical protein